MKGGVPLPFTGGGTAGLVVCNRSCPEELGFGPPAHLAIAAESWNPSVPQPLLRLIQPPCTAGFPLLYPEVPDLVLAIKYDAQGMAGGDFECNGTLVPGMCAISSVYVAVPACTNSFAGKCTAVVVFTHGMDGCSEEVAVLKQTRLVPSNSFMSPTGKGDEAAGLDQKVGKDWKGLVCLAERAPSLALDNACLPGTSSSLGHPLPPSLQCTPTWWRSTHR